MSTDPVIATQRNLARDNLTNDDLTPAEERNWKLWDLFCFWMSSIHSLGGYATAASLFVLGLNAWQVFFALIAGNLIVTAGTTMTGIAGQKVGVPYAVFARLSFGVYGARFAALIRAVLGVVWYGIQTYLASTALVVVLLKLAPGLESWTHYEFMGQSALGWACFAGFWVIQLLVIRRGMETVRRFIDFCGPAIWVVMIALAIWIVVEAHGDISLSLASSPQILGGSAWYAVPAATLLVVSYSAVPMTNFADFARFVPDTKTVVIGNVVGYQVNQWAFAILSVVVTTGSVVVFGAAITNPVDIVDHFNSPIILILAAATFAVATMGINVCSNFVSPAYDFAAIFPKLLTFKSGGLVTAVCALLVMPWWLYGNASAITAFNGVQGALAGPLLGILLVDFFVCRRSRFRVDDLFRSDEGGLYFYSKGIHWPALIVFIVATAIVAPLTVIPSWNVVAPLGWPIGVVLGAGGYYFATRRHFEAYRRTVTETDLEMHRFGESSRSGRPVAGGAGVPAVED